MRKHDRRRARSQELENGCKREEARKIRGGGAMTPALPREAPASASAPSDTLTLGLSARMRRIANRSPSTTTLRVRMITGSRSHMIDLSDADNQSINLFLASPQ